MDRDFHLTELGRQQAHAAGAQLARIAGSISVIYTSRLTRARETAKIVQSYLEAPLHLHPDIHEHGSDVFMLDCSVIEAARRFPEKVDASGAVISQQGRSPGLNPEFSVGGETLSQLHQRAKAAASELLALHPGPDDRSLVVSHGSFLSAMASELLGIPIRPAWSFQFANAAWMQLRFNPSELTGEPLASIVFPNALVQQTVEPSEQILQGRP
jgi:broad specificity phosphatase PhoE